MTEREKILKLMQFAFIEMRYELLYGDKNCAKMGQLADLFHHVPLSLTSDRMTDTEKLQNLIDKSKQHTWLNHWILANLKNMEA